MAHHRFLARTILVGERGLNAAIQAVSSIMTAEGQTKDINLKRYYEKPTVKRRRIKYENSIRLYNKEMQRKVDFLTKHQRKITPWS